MVIHVASAYRHADILTKPLSKDSFEFHRGFLVDLSHVLTLLEPQSRFGDKPLKLQEVCPQYGIAVL